MKRTNQILSTGFTLLVLFLNIGLTLSLNNGLHAHILGDNQILVHYHHSQGGNHTHHSTDSDSASNFVFSATLTYLNNALSISLRSAYTLINTNTVVLKQCSYHARIHHHSLWRGPPVA